MTGDRCAFNPLSQRCTAPVTMFLAARKLVSL
jgi:hypothetical protein